MNNIYGLVDPRRPDWVMYVGKGLKKRACEHWKIFVRNGWAQNALLRHWFEQLQADGIEPSFVFLEENVSNWQEAERDWIAAWRQVNSQLCNVANGGNQWPINIVSSRAGGLKTSQLYPGLAKQIGAIGGHVTNDTEHRANPNYIASKQKSGGISSPRKTEAARKNAFIGGKIGGKVSSKRKTLACRRNGFISAHVRSHVKKHKINPKCVFCLGEK